MAKVSGGSSGGSGSGWTPPTTPVGGLLVIQEDGSVVAKTDAELLAKSLQAQEGIEGGSVTAGAVTASEDGHTGQMTPDSLTFDAVEVTKDQFEGIQDSAVGPGDPAAAVSQVPPVNALTPGGKLTVPPAHIQTTGDNAVQLNAAADSIALVFTPEADYTLDSLSVYLKTIATTGNMSLGLYDTVMGYIADGSTNKRSDCYTVPIMTAAAAPSPFVARIYNSAGAESYYGGNSADSVYGLWHALRQAGTASTGSGVAPTAENPVYALLSLDQARVYNKMRLLGTGAADPSAFSLWGSAAASVPTINTDDGWTALGSWTAQTFVSGTFKDITWSNTTAYKHWRLKITDRAGGSAYVQFADIRFIEAEIAYIPNTLLQDIGALDVGSSNGVWLRKTFDAYQCYRDKPVAVVASGADTKDFSVSTRRLNVTAGSSLPDRCRTLVSTDNKATWTNAYQDIADHPAMWNIVLNSTTHHCPQLVYGRKSGDSVPLHNGTDAWALHTIPVAGIRLDCEALTKETDYGIYLYDNAGTLTLEASATGIVSQDGQTVMSGATNKLRLGRIMLLERQTGYQGPIDVEDRRLVANRFNRTRKTAQKGCPYSGDTNLVLKGITVAETSDWVPVFHYGDIGIDCQILCELDTPYLATLLRAYSDSSNPLAIAIDGRVPITSGFKYDYSGPASTAVMLTPGFHRVEIQFSYTGAGSTIYLAKFSARPYYRLGLNGIAEV